MGDIDRPVIELLVLETHELARFASRRTSNRDMTACWF